MNTDYTQVADLPKLRRAAYAGMRRSAEPSNDPVRIQKAKEKRERKAAKRLKDMVF